MNRPLRMMGTLCLLLLAVLTGRAATVNAVWDFSDEFASFETIQGTTGTFTNNGVVLTVDATNGKFRANGSHKATAAEVKAGYVLIASTNNNSYIKSVAVTQHQPEPVLEVPRCGTSSTPIPLRCPTCTLSAPQAR